MEHRTHDGNHDHIHNENCGHTRIEHEGHVDFLHDGHLHFEHEGHYDEHVLAVNAQNPANCAPLTCDGNHNDELVPHGDHQDFLIDGRLHHHHGDHCDDHGEVTVLAA